MAGFASHNAIINAWSVDLRGQKLHFHKVMAQSSTSNIPASLWNATGNPSAGSYGSVGKANGRTCTSATTGAMPFTNASGGRTMHLIAGEVTTMTSSATGALVLVDRISDCLLAHAEASGSITGLSATSRLASGQGAQIFCEVQSAFSAASNTITFTYTNQAGTGSRTTGSIVTSASAAVGRSVNANLWQPLQSGDTGVRSIESVTLSSGTATGQYAVCLVRPLGSIPIGVNCITASRDFVLEMPNLERIYDDSCLQLIYIPSGGVTATMFGTVHICEN
jgi:hypothetical protein